MKSESVIKKENAPLPCPFCGTKPKITEGWGAPAGVGVAWTITISCQSKKCAIKPQFGLHSIYKSKSDKILRIAVIKVWNKRKA